MKMVFQQKVQEKESKLKQSEEELYARHKEMKDALDKQRSDLEEKKRKIESGRPLTPEKSSVSRLYIHHGKPPIINLVIIRLRRRIVSSERREAVFSKKVANLHLSLGWFYLTLIIVFALFCYAAV